MPKHEDDGDDGCFIDEYAVSNVHGVDVEQRLSFSSTDFKLQFD